MSNTYQAGLKFERVCAGRYMVRNIHGRVIANITRHKDRSKGIHWNLKIVDQYMKHIPPLTKGQILYAHKIRSYTNLTNAKDWIRDRAFQNLHLAEA